MTITRKIIAGLTAAAIAFPGVATAHAQSSFGSLSSSSAAVPTPEAPESKSGEERLEEAIETAMLRGNAEITAEAEAIAEEYAELAVAGEIDFISGSGGESNHRSIRHESGGYISVNRDLPFRIPLLIEEMEYSYAPTFQDAKIGVAVSSNEDLVYQVLYIEDENF